MKTTIHASSPNKVILRALNCLDEHPIDRTNLGELAAKIAAANSEIYGMQQLNKDIYQNHRLVTSGRKFRNSAVNELRNKLFSVSEYIGGNRYEGTHGQVTNKESALKLIMHSIPSLQDLLNCENFSGAALLVTHTVYCLSGKYPNTEYRLQDMFCNAPT